MGDLRVLALGVVAAACAVYLLPGLLPLTVFVPALGLCLLRFPGRTLLAVCLISAAWTTFLAGQHMQQRLPANADGTVRTVHGYIASLPDAGTYRTRFAFASDSTPHRLRLSWYRNAPTLAVGDCYELRVKLSAPHGSANPGSFDYEKWLWRKGLGATGYVKSAHRCAPDRGSRIQSWRQHIVQSMGAVLGDHPMRGIIEALTVGVTHRISDAQWQVFRNTGTSHLVAISGWHIGLVAGWLLFLARFLLLRVPLRLPVLTLSALLSLTGASLYAMLAGLALPTLRAIVMLAAALVALLYTRRISFGRVLALAAIVVIAWRPMAVLAPGFWLSFGAVAWIVYLVRTRPRSKLAFVVRLQLGICVGLAPLTLYLFHQTSLVAPLVNFVVIPMAGVYVPILLLSVMATLVSPVLGGPLLQHCADALAAFWPLMAGVADLSLAAVSRSAPDLLAVIIALVGIGLLFAPRGLPGRWLGWLLLLPLAIGWRPPASAIPYAGYRLTVLDVGHGLATVIRTRHHVLVYDAGPSYRSGFNTGRAIVVPYLRRVRVHDIDVLMISHDDNDHIGGAAAVADALPVARRLGAGSDMPCHTGQSWRWDGVDFRVLSPLAADQKSTTNNRSCVLRVSGPGGVTLLTGDIETAAEQALVARAEPLLHADIVVVPHHGSNTSSTPGFVAATRPQYAMVSSGWHGRWGFPKPAVVARYRQAGAVVMDTATGGALLARLWPDQPIRVRRWRLLHQRMWQLPHAR